MRNLLKVLSFLMLFQSFQAISMDSGKPIDLLHQFERVIRAEEAAKSNRLTQIESVPAEVDRINGKNKQNKSAKQSNKSKKDSFNVDEAVVKVSVGLGLAITA